MMTNLVDVQLALKHLVLPAFVHSVSAQGHRPTWMDGQRDYDYILGVCLRSDEVNPYNSHRDAGKFGAPRSNHPFPWPANSDALRAQVCAAILMGVCHETIEQLSEGGRQFCAPHQHRGGSPADSTQWVGLLDALHHTVVDYAALMPAW